MIDSLNAVFLNIEISVGLWVAWFQATMQRTPWFPGKRDSPGGLWLQPQARGHRSGPRCGPPLVLRHGQDEIGRRQGRGRPQLCTFGGLQLGQVVKVMIHQYGTSMRPEIERLEISGSLKHAIFKGTFMIFMDVLFSRYHGNWGMVTTSYQAMKPGLRCLF